MKITVSPTPVVIITDGVPMRIWTGTTESGAPVRAYIRQVEVPTGRIQDWEREGVVTAEPVVAHAIEIGPADGD